MFFIDKYIFFYIKKMHIMVVFIYNLGILPEKCGETFFRAEKTEVLFYV